MAAGGPAGSGYPVVVIDSSLWISRLLPADSNHGAARGWVARHVQSGGTLLAPTMLAIETAAGVARATNNTGVGQRAAEDLYLLPYVRLIALDAPLVEQTIRVAAGQRLRGADAIFVALAQREGVPLVTFDREQLSRAAALVPVIRP